jgi:2-keto-4-pentenoate hydratase
MVPMHDDAISAAASLLWQHWNQATRLPELPAHCRPADRADGYRIQSALVSFSGRPTVGWKIAATSLAGQQHIGVDGPVAGGLLDGRVLLGGATVSLKGNFMRLAEAEFAFRVGRDLPRRDAPYDVSEVMEAVDSLQPAIELPDSRYEDVARVGAAHLIADDACACWLVVGRPAAVEWRALDLSEHQVVACRNGVAAETGTGGNVLGDPRLALTWLANELRTYGQGLCAGEIVTTGTCITPVPIVPGDIIRADFGALGALEVRLVA